MEIEQEAKPDAQAKMSASAGERCEAVLAESEMEEATTAAATVAAFTEEQRRSFFKAVISGEWSRIKPLLQLHGFALAGVDLDGRGVTALHGLAMCAPDVPASAESIQHLAAIDAVNIEAWVSFGVAEFLSFRQNIFELAPRARHVGQDVITSTIENTVDSIDTVRRKPFAQCFDDWNTASHGGLVR